MMKIIGIVIMTISTILFGLSFYKKYKLRPESIDLFINLISKYLLELKWKRKSFLEVLKECDENSYLINFKSLSAFNTLEDSAIYKNNDFDNLYLNDKDVLVIKTFLKDTGKSGFDNEVLLCTNTIDQLKKQKEEAEINYKKMGPLSIKLSVIIAIWIAIMFI